MNSEVIKSYLVSIGFDVDGKGFKEAQQSFGKIEQAINSLFKKLADSGALDRFKKKFQDVMGSVEKRIAGTPVIGKIFDFLKNLALKVVSVKGIIAAAVIALGAIITKVTYSFMSKMAAADMEVQKLALSLFTTTQNARSLKSVMDSMGVGSIEELRAVAMNPELRAQFMSLRKTAAGLEGGADVQQGFRNTRAAGNELNRLGVIMNYFWQNLGGKLGHTLAGPLKAFEEFMSSFNELLVANMPAITEAIAGMFAIAGIVVEVLFKGLNLLTKIAGTFSWVGRLINLGVEILYGGLSGKLAQSVTKEFVQQNKTWFDSAKRGAAAYTPTPFGGVGGNVRTKGLDLGNTADFLKRLAPNLPGVFDVTSAKEARGHGPRSHASGNKFDLGFAGKNVEQIIQTMFALQGTPGFVFGGLEGSGHMLDGSRISDIIQKFQRMGGDASKFGDYTSGRTTGPHIDVLTKPIQVSVSINGNVKDEATAAYLGDKIGQQFRNALGIRSNEGAFA